MSARGIDELRMGLSNGDLFSPVSISDLCRRSVALLDVAGATITLSSERFGEQPIAAFEERFGAIEDLQFTLGQGPGVDAAASGADVLCEPLQDCGHRWPQFVPAALDRGVRGVLALPLRVGTVGLGVLTLYSDGGSFPRAVVAEARIVSELVVEVLLAQQAGSEKAVTLHASDGLDSAITHQATGMIGAQLECGMEEALVRLRAFSFSHDRTVLDVARDVVSRKLRFTNEAGE